MTDNNLLGDTPKPTKVALVAEKEATVTPLVQPTPVANAGEVPTEATPTPAANSLIVTNVASSAKKSVADFDAITDSLLGQIGDLGSKACLKMLVYGDPGSTKSSFLGTAPNNLVYTFEDGMIAAKMAHVTSGRQIADNVKEIPFVDLEQADELIERLETNHPAFDKWTVFSVDTISTMHKRMLEYVMKREKMKRPSMNEYAPETEHYTEVNEILTRFVRAMAMTNRDIIVVCHAQTVEPKGKPSKTYPDFSEKLANKLEAMMDIVAHVTMEEWADEHGNKRPRPYFRVVSDGGVHAKTRIPLPPVILDPTWDQFKAKWEEAKASGSLTD
jgi:hypothetical protein